MGRGANTNLARYLHGGTLKLSYDSSSCAPVLHTPHVSMKLFASKTFAGGFWRLRKNWPDGMEDCIGALEIETAQAAARCPVLVGGKSSCSRSGNSSAFAYRCHHEFSPGKYRRTGATGHCMARATHPDQHYQSARK